MSEQVVTTVNDELATLLIPMNGKQLVVPNVTVAEIIPYIEPSTEQSDLPTWFLGNINWRGIEVPVVSFEAINEEPFVSQSANRRIAVLNALVDGEKLPFCGLIAESVPRLMRIQPNDIVNEDVETGPAELGHVLVHGEQAVIPNVDYIQEQVLALQ
ncbi:chemotaxis protein CheW [Dasania sp. GY-MA-18]|uniref:Chemotaxis protein CheW n=1 Tax=Dasania phycosphaerae TaxID=2950436 RepID=A0A9J6RK23_9GAMM|nr:MULTISPECIES: chemotaxis protein CheW [Dasania]MCR8922148.1 chemotaxis protein CheW [Dasania sp. GY-MA-18]MCZ0864576.1 chemotaxis protein CheW [Dasania phycosphaerae]MCZ0868304.1 chemotaxis protein CheW [Dasania phycosphaerae]